MFSLHRNHQRYVAVGVAKVWADSVCSIDVADGVADGVGVFSGAVSEGAEAVVAADDVVRASGVTGKGSVVELADASTTTYLLAFECSSDRQNSTQRNFRPAWLLACFQQPAQKDPGQTTSVAEASGDSVSAS